MKRQKSFCQSYLKDCIYSKREQIAFKISLLFKNLLLILVFLSPLLFKGFLEDCI